jgi:hypothetical protein
MAEDTRELVPLSESWRTRTLMAGGIIGALLGLLSAYLYVRAADDSLEPGEAPEGPQARDAAKLGVALLAIVRTVAEWGKKPKTE